MRKPSRAGGVAVGALAVALTAGAFAFATASAAVTTVTSSKVPASDPAKNSAEGRWRRAGRGRVGGHLGHQPSVRQLGRVRR